MVAFVCVLFVCFFFLCVCLCSLLLTCLFVCRLIYLFVFPFFVSQGRKHIGENATGPAGKDAKIIYRGLLSKSKCVFSLDLVQQRTY